MNSNKYYNEFFELGQQKINFNFFELTLPDDDPVYTLKKVMEEMDFSSLLARYSNKGRNGFNPIMKYAVLTYANMRGVKEVDRIVELCERDLAFIWLTQGEKPKRDAFYDFINHKLTAEILDDLNYQFPMCYVLKFFLHKYGWDLNNKNLVLQAQNLLRFYRNIQIYRNQLKFPLLNHAKQKKDCPHVYVL